MFLYFDYCSVAVRQQTYLKIPEARLSCAHFLVLDGFQNFFYLEDVLGFRMFSGCDLLFYRALQQKICTKVQSNFMKPEGKPELRTSVN